LRRERHSRPGILSDFILGTQDGMVNILGILLGLAAAGAALRLVFIGALAALGAESISMGAVAYTSTSARRQVYLKERSIELQEMTEIPENEKDEVRNIFRSWGYEGEELEDLAQRIFKNPRATLELMMSYELKLAPVEKSDALRSFFVVGSSAVFGSLIPLIPFLFTGNNIMIGTEVSVIFSGIALFLVGVYEAKTTVGSLWENGLRMTFIGLTAGLAGFLIGHFISAFLM